MRKSIIVAIIGFTFLVGKSDNAILNLKSVDLKFSTMRPQKHIDIWLTSKGGCKFHIVGEASAFPPSFSGNISASGNPPCPNGSWDVSVKNPVETNDLLFSNGSIEGFNVLIENSDLKQALINAIN